MSYLKYGFLACLAGFLFIQLLPGGPNHQNPTTDVEPEWDSPRTRELAVRACFDCHSNKTKWPWYSYVAPFSWEIAEHVEEAREHLNFSEFNRRQKDAHEAPEEVEEGEMPLSDYLWLHPSAKLNDEERQALIAGLKATLGDENDEND